MSSLPRIETRVLAEPGSLAGDFVAGEPAARRLLSCSTAGAAVGARGPVGGAGAPDAAGAALREARPARLAPEAFGTSSPEAAAALARILAGEGCLVSTGQQPLLFLGPLFVVYKALTAIERAHRIERQTGQPCLAAFWIASDDHDWEEIGVTRLLDAQESLRTLRVEPPPEREGRSVGPARLPASVGERLSELREALPPSATADAWLSTLADRYTPGASFAEAFAATLADALEGRPFVWLDAAASAVKQAGQPLLRRALEESRAVRARLEEATDAVRAAGYEPRVPLLPQATAVFMDTGERRERLYRDDDTVRLGRRGEKLPLDEVLTRLDREPERFSPNVALRPVLESWLLPVRTAVLGPGEIEYWAQLTGLFDLFDAPLPHVAPRASFALVEPRVERLLDKTGATVEALADGGEAAAQRRAREARPAELESALARLSGAVRDGYAELAAVTRQHLPGVRASVDKTAKRAARLLAELEKQIDARLREEEEVALRQLRRCALHLFPEGRPQERVQSPFYFLGRYGADLLAGLESAIGRQVAEGEDVSADGA